MTDFDALDSSAQLQRLETLGRDALSNWSMEGASLDLIKYRENAVFRVEQNGSRAALRLHRYGYHNDAALRSELQWMQALSNSGVMVPNVVPTTTGEPFVTCAGEGLPGEIQIDLFEWINGEQLGSVEAGVANTANVDTMYRSIGELAARVHNQASAWQPPRGFERHAWDADGLAGDEPFWGPFWKISSASKSETEILQKTRRKIHADLSALPKTAANYSMIHADFAPENIMVDGDALRLIDFDDAGFGWHMFELATSLYFLLGEPYFNTARDALIEGYRSQRDLPDSELDLLPLFLLARGTTYIGWVHSRSETETARELTPMLLSSACELAENYLQN